ncbi:hypothetical protein [Streptomyces sp. MNP-20]|uniref:hypothetical protein n=1 Tax=Streptomyces sp. MNP-20 TaxID=2721165 RepID=UPI001557DA85|nr:hypothetical protein [Streptomyces sp. MNP-20]
MREATYLKRAGLFALGPFVLGLTSVLVGHKIHYPDNNANGLAYVDYLVPNFGGERQTVAWLALQCTIMVFFVLLALAYYERAGRMTPGILLMVTGITAFTTLQITMLGLFEAIPYTAREHPGFGTTAQDQRMLTFAWNGLALIIGLSMIMLAIACAAVYLSNRQYTVLPPALGGWSAAAVAAVSAGFSFESVFVRTGSWSVGSLYWVLAVCGTVFAWMAVTGITLLRAAHATRPAPAPSGDAALH